MLRRAAIGSQNKIKFLIKHYCSYNKQYTNGTCSTLNFSSKKPKFEGNSTLVPPISYTQHSNQFMYIRNERHVYSEFRFNMTGWLVGADWLAAVSVRFVNDRSSSASRAARDHETPVKWKMIKICHWLIRNVNNINWTKNWFDYRNSCLYLYLREGNWIY